jgi:hypothetical protein
VPAGDYVETGKTISFATVIESARRRDEVAMGYRKAKDASDASKSYGVRLNSSKAPKVEFEEGDKVIVLASS